MGVYYYRMENTQQKTLDDILEIVTFLKDNGASKEDLKELATEKDVQAVRTQLVEVDQRLTREIKELDKKLAERLNALTTNVDSFITLHQKLDTELTAMRSKYSRLESHLQFLAKHLNLALPE